jgi:hypothetical protein
MILLHLWLLYGQNDRNSTLLSDLSPEHDWWKTGVAVAPSDVTLNCILEMGIFGKSVALASSSLA